MRSPLLFFTSLAAFAVLAATSTAAATVPAPVCRNDADKKATYEECQTGDECVSGVCGAAFSGPDVCYTSPAGTPCKTHNDCESNDCGADGKCTDSLYKPCSDYLECAAPFYNAHPLWCPAGECVKYYGGDCTTDRECGPNRCYEGQCRRYPRRPNGDCDVDAECVPGSGCVNNYVDPYCYTDDGSLTQSCFNFVSHCTRLATGSACLVDGDCLHGFCDNGTCGPGANGRACKSDFQCTEKDAICTTQGVCATPAPASLYPQEHCLLASTCRTGQCAHNNITNKYDRSYFLEDYRTPQPFTCDYFDLGEGPCRSYVDCREGLCISGTCTRGPDGAACLYNQHCQNVCGKDGKCYTPPATGLADGEPCRENAQCANGKCDGGYVNRPVPGSTTGEKYDAEDTLCLDPTPPPPSDDGGYY